MFFKVFEISFMLIIFHSSFCTFCQKHRPSANSYYPYLWYL